MSFLKSMINQVGRDMGKVISNQIYKDAHATPYRKIASSGNRQTNRISSNFKSEFDKAINFHTGSRPSILINRLAGAYTILKNEANKYISDGYLDGDEANELFLMLDKFNKKIEDIYDVIELDEEGYKKETEQLEKIVQRTNDLFRTTLKIAAQGCTDRKEHLLAEMNNIKDINFLRFVFLNTIWMGKYARTDKMNIAATILANIGSVFVMFIPYFFTFFYGIFTYPQENNKRKIMRNTYKKLIDLEDKRAEIYLNISKNSINDLQY